LVVIVIVVAVAIGALTALAMLPGCTPAQQALTSAAASPTTVTALKIAACAQGALAEEEQQRLRDRREAERQAAEEAEAIAEVAREHPGSVKAEIDKVLRDGGTKQ
jgi:hypothetical protein